METQPWDFPVTKKPLHFFDDSGAVHEVPHKKAIVRTDRQESLAVVSDGYVVVPHVEILEQHLEPFIQKFGPAQRKVSVSKSGDRMMAEYFFKHISKEVAKGDTVGFGLKAVGAYDGKTAIKLAGWAERLACLNGMTSRFGYIAANFRHNEKQVSQIAFPEKEFFLEQFDQDIEFWASLTQMDITAEDHQRFAHNIVLTKGLLSPSQNVQLKEKFASSDTPWDYYNALTEFLTHKTKASPFTLHNRLTKVNEIIDLTFIKREEIPQPIELDA